MPEIGEGIKTELTQVKNFSKGYREFRKSDYQPGRLQKTILLGLLTVAPDETRASGIVKDPERMKVIDKLLRYQVALNDKIDYEGSGRDDISQETDEVREREVVRLGELNEAVEALPTDQQTQFRRNFQNYVSDLSCIETDIRTKRDSGTISIPQVDTYRSLVNAAYNLLVSSVIFNQGQLEPRLYSINRENPTIEEVTEKYRWMLDSNPHPQNNVECAVTLMHNLAQAGQVDNDWWGHRINNLLNTPSYASAALDVTHDDKKAARQLLKPYKDAYINRAKSLGLGRLPTHTMMGIFHGLKAATMIGLEKIKDHPRLHRVTHSRMPVRETMYVHGRLDPKSFTK